ncbi:MAG: hypothetical protein V2A73_05200, partial [Pseudomonadota bacterium]
DLANCELNIRYTRVHRTAMARAVEQLRRRALEQADARRCRQCGELLPAVTVVSQAVGVTCAACSGANVVDPGPAMRMFAAGAIYLGQVAAADAWDSWKRAEARIDNYRNKGDVPMALLKELESSARQYWTTTLSVEAEHVPELQPHVVAKVDSYMKEVRKKLQDFWQWRQQV